MFLKATNVLTLLSICFQTVNFVLFFYLIGAGAHQLNYGVRIQRNT